MTSKAKMIEEHPNHFVMHDGKSSFRVPKKGTEDIHDKIRKMADGGTVDALPERRGLAPTVFNSHGEPVQISPQYAPALIPPAAPWQAPPNRPEAFLSDPGFDQQAYDNAKAGKYPKGGPEAYQAMRGRAADIDREAATKKAASDIGIRPKSEEQTASTDPEVVSMNAAKTPMSPRRGSYLSVPGDANPEMDSAMTDAIAAERAKSSAEAEGARNMAAAEGEHQKMLAQQHLEQINMLQRANSKADADMDAIKAASTQMASDDSTVDPGRLWASRSTPQKVAAIIGMALGTFSPDGVNRSVSLLNQAIDRDIDAQKAEHDIRLRKGQAAVGAATSMYSLHHQSLQDDIAARASAKATADEIAASKIKQIMASTQDSVRQAQGMEVIANLRSDAAKNHQVAMERVFNDTLNRDLKQSEVSKNYAEVGKLNAAGPGGVGGLPTPEQGKLFDVKAASQNVRNNIARAKDIIKKSGTFELTGTDQTELERVISDIAQDSARLKDPGNMVKEGELENARKAIGIKGGELLTRNSTAIKLLDSYAAGMDQREREAFAARGLRPSSSAADIERKGKK